MPILFMCPIWHSFPEISADAEAAFASSSSLFSLATLEVTHDPGFPGFALTEREHQGTWRWALVSAEGPVINEGRESTISDAKRCAVGAMRIAIAG